MNPLPVGFCGSVQLGLVDPATNDVPRNQTGNRVTMADFDLVVVGPSVVGNQIDATHFDVCACQGGTPGATATIIAMYPGRALASNASVRGVAVQQTATVTLAPPKGTVNPKPCLAAASGTPAPSRTAAVSIRPSAPPTPRGVSTAPPPPTGLGTRLPGVTAGQTKTPAVAPVVQAPTGLATQGNSWTWAPVPGARGYRIWRFGMQWYHPIPPWPDEWMAIACEWTLVAEVSTTSYSPRWSLQYNASEARHVRLACGDDDGGMYRFQFGYYVTTVFDAPSPSGTMTTAESGREKLP